jgi:hypothetical protein
MVVGSLKTARATRSLGPSVGWSLVLHEDLVCVHVDRGRTLMTVFLQLLEVPVLLGKVDDGQNISLPCDTLRPMHGQELGAAEMAIDPRLTS